VSKHEERARRVNASTCPAQESNDPKDCNCVETLVAEFDAVEAEAKSAEPGGVDRIVPLSNGDIEVWSDGHAHTYSPTSRLVAAEDDVARLRTALTNMLETQLSKSSEGDRHRDQARDVMRRTA